MKKTKKGKETGKKEKTPETGATTFARRYMPDDSLKALRYRAIRDAYMSMVAPRVKSQSKFQDKGLKTSDFITVMVLASLAFIKLLLVSFKISPYFRPVVFTSQDPFFKKCSYKLKQSRANTYSSAYAVASEFAPEFLEEDTVRNLGSKKGW